MRIIITAIFITGFSISVFAVEKPEPATKAADIETIAVQTIVEKANTVAYYQGEDGKAKVKMVITSKQGQKRRNTNKAISIQTMTPPPSI